MLYTCKRSSLLQQQRAAQCTHRNVALDRAQLRFEFATVLCILNRLWQRLQHVLAAIPQPALLRHQLVHFHAAFALSVNCFEIRDGYILRCRRQRWNLHAVSSGCSLVIQGSCVSGGFLIVRRPSRCLRSSLRSQHDSRSQITKQV